MTKHIHTLRSPLFRASADWHSAVRNLIIVVIGTVMALIAFLLCVLTFKTSAPFTVIEVKTTTLHQIVERPAAVQMSLSGLEKIRSHGSCSKLQANLTTEDLIQLRPAVQTNMIYRYHAGKLSISLNAPTDASSAGKIIFNETTCDLGQRSRLTLIQAENSAFVLPIAGPASAGSEAVGADQARGHFFGGKVTIYGRALLPPAAGSLYPTGDAPLTLAEGGRLTAELNLSEGDSWFGTARVSETHMIVSATSETNGLRIVRPGSNGEVELLAIGLLAQLFKDPSVAPWSIGLFFVVSALHLTIAVVSLLPDTRPEENKTQNTIDELPQDSEPQGNESDGSIDEIANENAPST